MTKALTVSITMLLFLLSALFILTSYQIRRAEELIVLAEDPQGMEELKKLWDTSVSLMQISLKRQQVEKCDREIELLSYCISTDILADVELQRLKTVQALKDLKQALIPKII
ncbi:MAG: hypothetical protein E7646_08120 [Ruminococcaceae bacterium]|nr:hypothetical protein [Oscillospiraceae bacterium]